jgi:hypothetical protein
MALEPQDRPKTMKLWMELLDSPLPKRNDIDVVQLIESKPFQEQTRESIETRQVFSENTLKFFLAGYVPIGIIVGLSNNWVMVGTLAIIGSHTGLAALSETWMWTRILAVTWVGAFALSGSWTLVGSWVGALVGLLAFIEFRPTSYIVVFSTLLGSILGTATVSYFTNANILIGVGAVLYVIFQLLITMTGIVKMYSDLEGKYDLAETIGSFMGTTIPCLALGGGIGWWLKLSGVKLPI